MQNSNNNAQPPDLSHITQAPKQTIKAGTEDLKRINHVPYTELQQQQPSVWSEEAPNAGNPFQMQSWFDHIYEEEVMRPYLEQRNKK